MILNHPPLDLLVALGATGEVMMMSTWSFLRPSVLPSVFAHIYFFSAFSFPIPKAISSPRPPAPQSLVYPRIAVLGLRPLLLANWVALWKEDGAHAFEGSGDFP